MSNVSLIITMKKGKTTLLRKKFDYFTVWIDKQGTFKKQMRNLLDECKQIVSKYFPRFCKKNIN